MVKQIIDRNTLLSEWLPFWLRVHKLPAIRRNTQNEYRSHVGKLLSLPISEKCVGDITRSDCQDVLNTIAAEGYAKSTVKKYRVILKQAMMLLVDDGIIERNPASKLFIPIAPTKNIVALTHEEQQELEAACATDPLGHLIIFLLHTGLRKGEMAGLLWQDYDPTEGSIFIREAKTDAGIRKVYLIKAAQAIIERMPHINDHIFNHTRNAPITDTVMRRLVDRLQAKTGLKDFTCHVCRHTFVTRLCEKGTPAKAIAQIIGHAKADYVLDIYAKMEADELRKAVYILDDSGEHYSTLMGATVSLPVQLYTTLQKEAVRQKVSVNTLATYLLSSIISKNGDNLA